MFMFTYTAAILAFIYLGFAAFIFIKKRQNSLALFLALHMLADALWIGSNAGADVARNDIVLIIWSGLAFIGASFQASFFLCFVDSFIYNHRPKRSIIFIYLLPSILFSLFAFSKYSVQETIFPSNIPTQIVPGVLYKLYPFFFFGSLIYSGIKLIKSYKKATWQKRRQIIYLSIGFLLLFFGNIFFTVIWPLLGELRFFNVGPQFSIFLIALAAYTIFKHRLLDIKVVIQRSLIFTILLFGIISFYLLVLLILQAVFNSHHHSTSLVSALVTILLGIFGVPHIEKIFRKLTDKIFFKDDYDYSKALQEISKILSKNFTLRDLLKEIQNKLKYILKVKTVSCLLVPQNLVFNDKKGNLQKVENIFGNNLLNMLRQQRNIIITSEIISNGHKELVNNQLLSDLKQLNIKLSIAVIVPLMVDAELVGVLYLHPKLSGGGYQNKDIRLLKTVSYQLALGLARAKLYKQVKDYSNNLEVKVAQRTAKIRSLQKRQAQMIFDIAHQLQTPLTVIKGEIGSLRFLQEVDPTFLKSFETSIDRLSRFTNGMLSLAKLDFEVNQGNDQIINLSELLHNLIEYYSVLAIQDNINIISNIKNGIFVKGLEDRLEELITNLVSNSFKYIAEPREVEISLKTNNYKAIIMIADTGIGIASEDLPYLFKRFYRSVSTNNKIRGSGLGLAICKKIVDNYSGRIDIKSQLGKGTQVIVELPLVNSDKK